MRTSILASISSASLSVHLLPDFWFRRQRSAKRVSELGRRRTRVVVFSGGSVSFELSFELTCLNSSISTIMHPASGKGVVNDSVLGKQTMNATRLHRREPWPHRRARGGLRVSDSPLCHQTEPECCCVNRRRKGKGREGGSVQCKGDCCTETWDLN